MRLEAEGPEGWDLAFGWDPLGGFFVSSWPRINPSGVDTDSFPMVSRGTLSSPEVGWSVSTGENPVEKSISEDQYFDLLRYLKIDRRQVKKLKRFVGGQRLHGE